MDFVCLVMGGAYFWPLDYCFSDIEDLGVSFVIQGGRNRWPRAGRRHCGFRFGRVAAMARSIAASARILIL
jgi:hypothetical protein